VVMASTSFLHMQRISFILFHETAVLRCRHATETVQSGTK
jgi:hypothetical protein